MWLKSALFYIVQFGLLINLIFGGEVGDNCHASEKSSEGLCVLATDCTVAMRDIQRTDHHQLKRCGFVGLKEIVCCPKGAYKLPRPSTAQPTNSTGKSYRTSGDNNLPEEKQTRFAEREDNLPEKKQTRIADRECQKIINESELPIDLHIIGGKNASLGEFPHMVALGFKFNGVYDFLCGGSVISKTFLITAAHCVETLDSVTPGIVRAGVVDIKDKAYNEKTDIKIAEIIKHPNYTRKNKYHDIALIRLEKPMQFTTFMNAICLYTSDKNPKVPLSVTGWGKISSNRDIRSDNLLKASVSVVATEKCNESYKWHKLPEGIINEQICAGDLVGKQDTCQGDSGGPLQGLTGLDSHWRLVGITSFGRGCGLSVPGVYTRISHYLDWIESIVWPN